jgi:hypothetical protein
MGGQDFFANGAPRRSVAGAFLKSIQPAVQLGDVLRGKADRGGFSGNGDPQILEDLDFLGNRELF